ncbi:sigma-70 family RNA polymerase sigma factor [Nakamurella silvestris]|nr:sigma-70 family RNA polymerase sigma factor [Nakamurella silvestris]
MPSREKYRTPGGITTSYRRTRTDVQTFVRVIFGRLSSARRAALSQENSGRASVHPGRLDVFGARQRLRVRGLSEQGRGSGVEFTQFVQAHADELARYAAVLTGDRDDAHDLLADTLVKVSQRWSTVAGASSPQAYARRMLFSQFIDGRRSASASVRRIHGHVRATARPAVDPTLSVADRDVLDRALSDLPRQQRAALFLRYYLDLTSQAAAEEMGCSASTLRSHVAAGLAGLRAHDALKPEEG